MEKYLVGSGNLGVDFRSKVNSNYVDLGIFYLKGMLLGKFV